MSTESGAEWSRRVGEWYSAEAGAYRALWAPLLLPHGEALLDALPLGAHTASWMSGRGAARS